MHRCFVIWNRKKWVLVLPALLMLAGAASEHTHVYIMQLNIHLNTAQIPSLVVVYSNEVNPGAIQVITRFSTIPLTLFPLLTTLTVTTLSGESFPVLLSKFLSLILVVGSSFTYLVDQSSSKKDFG
jgi:hypothetical protein